MPRPIGIVQKPGLFEDLLKRLGVNRPLSPFQLDGDVVPVVIVESGISFVAAPTPAYTVQDIFTAGEQIAPAAGTVLADTGQLPVGQYSVQVFLGAGEGNTFDFQWRNAANAVTLRNIRLHVPVEAFPQLLSRFTVANANERFRVLNVGAGTVGVAYNATILAKI